MAVKIRLARRGRKKNPFYHIVVADARAPRDGKFIEKIGSYNPQTVPATIELDRDKAYDWLGKGAQPTDTVNAILKFKGVLYKKHLNRGVSKGALTQEEADKKLTEWIDVKESRIEARRLKTKEEKLEFHRMVSGDVKAKVKIAAPIEEQHAFRDNAPVEEQHAFRENPPVEAPAVEETPAVEEAPTVVEAIEEEGVAEAVVEPGEATAEETPVQE